MKKLILLLVLIMITTFTLTACGGQAGDSSTQTTLIAGDSNAESSDYHDSDSAESESSDHVDSMDVDAAQTLDAFVFVFRDVAIEMNQNVTYVIDQLGEPTGEFEAPSCAFDGIDRVFAYGTAVQIYTYPLGGNDHIHTVAFFDDTVRTTEGRIRLYDTVQAVIDAYGDDYEYDTGMYTFTRGRTVLEFLTADGIVIGISYRYLIDV